MAGEIIEAKTVLKVGQRIELYTENSDTRYSSRIEDITKDDLVIAMPVDSRRVPVIPRKNERIYTLAVGKQCRYRFFAVFKGTARQDGRIPVWRITKPETVERHQNREFVRVRVNLPLRVRLIDRQGTIGDPLVTRTVDLSGNGICFVSAKEVPVDTQAGIELDNIPNIGTLEVMCKIARCSCIPLDDERVIYHVGAGFQHLSRSVSNKLVNYIFEVQRKELALGIDI